MQRILELQKSTLLRRNAYSVACRIFALAAWPYCPTQYLCNLRIRSRRQFKRLVPAILGLQWANRFCNETRGPDQVQHNARNNCRFSVRE